MGENALELAIFGLSLGMRVMEQQRSIYAQIARASAEGRDVTPEEVAASKAAVDALFAATMERFKPAEGDAI
jgi:hypothetical protein